MLSARDRGLEKIEALDLGADDYVQKPFDVGEFLARLRAASGRRRRSRGQGRDQREATACCAMVSMSPRPMPRSLSSRSL